ncbi:MAG: hypothetical protein L6R35_004266 [Caloplaca aegaea]|nr:MAG: hypothetical protein L6R35_004266 [Caloplaca aegaea]
MTSENLPLVVAQKESRKDVINTAVSEALNSRIPDHSQMEPGRVYVGRLPNHNGPVLVRRRRKSFTNPFGVPSVASLWAPPRAPSLDYQNTTTAIYQPQPQSQMLIAQPRIYTTPPQVVEPPAYLGLPPLQPAGTTTTTITTTEAQPTLNTSSKHTCPACGKFRSARYHYRHPLAPGETPRPTLCRKCIKQHTSSEEFDEIERARWKKKKEQEARQRRIYRSSSSEHWESSSHSRSSSRSRWRRRRPNEYEEERVRVTIRSRDPSPGRYERHEHEYEERVGDPWRRGSESMIVHRDATTLETRGNGYFDRQRPSGRSFASSSQIQTRRARSPSILRRRSMENGLRDGRRVRFAHSDESEEGFRSAEQLVRERGFRHIRALSPAPTHYESRRRRISQSSNHDEDDDFGYGFDRGHLSPPIESYSYARRRSHSREHSDSYYGGGSYESRRRIRVIDV